MTLPEVSTILQNQAMNKEILVAPSLLSNISPSPTGVHQIGVRIRRTDNMDAMKPKTCLTYERNRQKRNCAVRLAQVRKG